MAGGTRGCPSRLRYRRYNRPMRTLTAIALTLTLATAASAQPSGNVPEPPATDPDPLYHIELIVFAFNEGNRSEEDFLHDVDDPQLGPNPHLLQLPRIELDSVFRLRSDTEILVADPAPIPNELALADPDAADPDAADPLTAPEEDGLELIDTDFGQDSAVSPTIENLPAGFRTLKASELDLGDARARLDRLSAYRVLGHAGWAQTGVDTDRSIQLNLRHLGITNPVGTVELYLRRFLHIALELQFYDGSGTLWNASGGPALTPFEYARSYPLTIERNAIRRGELHHIDHPLFGVLIRITPAPIPEDETGTEGDDMPAG